MAGGGCEVGLPHERRPPAHVSSGGRSLLAGARIRGSRRRAGRLQAQAFGPSRPARRLSDLVRPRVRTPGGDRISWHDRESGDRKTGLRNHPTRNRQYVAIPLRQTIWRHPLTLPCASGSGRQIDLSLLMDPNWCDTASNCRSGWRAGGARLGRLRVSWRQWHHPTSIVTSSGVTGPDLAPGGLTLFQGLENVIMVPWPVVRISVRSPPPSCSFQTKRTARLESRAVTTASRTLSFWSSGHLRIWSSSRGLRPLPSKAVRNGSGSPPNGLAVRSGATSAGTPAA